MVLGALRRLFSNRYDEYGSLPRTFRDELDGLGISSIRIGVKPAEGGLLVVADDCIVVFGALGQTVLPMGKVKSSGAKLNKLRIETYDESYEYTTKHADDVQKGIATAGL